MIGANAFWLGDDGGVKNMSTEFRAVIRGSGESFKPT